MASRARARGARPRLQVAVTGEGGSVARAPGLATWLRRHAPARARGTMTIALISDREMRRLNRTFRGKDAATDVLSFPAGGAGLRSISKDLGEIAIAVGVAGRQAREAGHSVASELRILALHGLLHLLGYDHEADQGEMETLEERLRRRAGLPAGLIARASSHVRR
jgi:probable rRNA maturation factor